MTNRGTKTNTTVDNSTMIVTSNYVIRSNAKLKTISER